MHEFSRLPSELLRSLGGEMFRRRRRVVLPLLTTDPDGFPRAALLTPGEVRAVSPTRMTVAVLSASRTAVNLIRRRQATLLFLQRNVAASIRLRAGRGRVSGHDPDRTLFPLAVFRVRLDQAAANEGSVAMLGGPTFTGPAADSLFSAELFAELSGAEEA
ncbi:MAG: hypothetical protein ABI592_09080 [Acidobacteriota bacterium]